jgi:hypothetical protein
MSRTLRKVPPNYQHPKVCDRRGVEAFRPMYDQTWADAVREWKDGYAAWERGEHPQFHAGGEFWEFYAPPGDPDDYRTFTDDEATWFCVYETVSEGTPVTPPFATAAELVDYLTTHGDFGRQQYGEPPWTRANAEAFIKAGWMPSAWVVMPAVGTGAATQEVPHEQH